MRNSMILCAVLLGFVLAGCQADEKGVKTSYRTQWTTVNASTARTTDAAKAVLEEQNLKEVMASSTALDGKASAKKADGTKINVDIQKKSDTTSEVSVNVGTMGDPEVGAEIARKIKDRAEKK